MIKAVCSGQKDALEAESSDSSCDEDLIAKAIDQRGRHRIVDRRGEGRLRKAPDFMKSQEPMSISKQAVQQYLTALGWLSDLWNGSTMDPTEADQVLVTFSRFEAVGPHLATHGPGKMLRCWRCLKGWKKMSSSTSKQPRPLATCCAFACSRMRRTHWMIQ